MQSFITGFFKPRSTDDPQVRLTDDPQLGSKRSGTGDLLNDSKAQKTAAESTLSIGSVGAHPSYQIPGTAGREVMDLTEFSDSETDDRGEDGASSTSPVMYKSHMRMLFETDWELLSNEEHWARVGNVTKPMGRRVGTNSALRFCAGSGIYQGDRYVDDPERTRRESSSRLCESIPGMNGDGDRLTLFCAAGDTYKAQGLKMWSQLHVESDGKAAPYTILRNSLRAPCPNASLLVMSMYLVWRVDERHNLNLTESAGLDWAAELARHYHKADSNLGWGDMKLHKVIEVLERLKLCGEDDPCLAKDDMKDAGILWRKLPYDLQVSLETFMWLDRGEIRPQVLSQILEYLQVLPTNVEGIRAMLINPQFNESVRDQTERVLTALGLSPSGKAHARTVDMRATHISNLANWRDAIGKECRDWKREQRQARSRASANDIKEGSEVEVSSLALSVYRPGRVDKENQDGTMDIMYDDGEEELGVNKVRVRLIGTGATYRPGEGTKVEANYKGLGVFYPAVVSYVHSNGTLNVTYNDDERGKEIGVHEDIVRVIAGRWFETGTKVEANYMGRGEFLPGIVSQLHDNGTMDIEYDDDMEEKGMRNLRMHANVRQMRARPEDVVGAYASLTLGDVEIVKLIHKLSWSEDYAVSLTSAERSVYTIAAANSDGVFTRGRVQFFVPADVDVGQQLHSKDVRDGVIIEFRCHRAFLPAQPVLTSEGDEDHRGCLSAQSVLTSEGEEMADRSEFLHSEVEIRELDASSSSSFGRKFRKNVSDVNRSRADSGRPGIPILRFTDKTEAAKVLNSRAYHPESYESVIRVDIPKNMEKGMKLKPTYRDTLKEGWEIVVMRVGPDPNIVSQSDRQDATPAEDIWLNAKVKFTCTTSNGTEESGVYKLVAHQCDQKKGTPTPCFHINPPDLKRVLGLDLPNRRRVTVTIPQGIQVGDYIDKFDSPMLREGLGSTCTLQFLGPPVNLVPFISTKERRGCAAESRWSGATVRLTHQESGKSIDCKLVNESKADFRSPVFRLNPAQQKVFGMNGNERRRVIVDFTEDTQVGQELRFYIGNRDTKVGEFKVVLVAVPKP